jgi:hypothetical protein
MIVRAIPAPLVYGSLQIGADQRLLFMHLVAYTYLSHSSKTVTRSVSHSPVQPGIKSKGGGCMKLLKILLPLLLLVFAGGTTRVMEAAQEGDKLVYADFETVKDNRPVSNRGGVVQLNAYQERASIPSRFKGAGDTNAPELVRLKKDDPNRAIAFDFEFQPPNQWAGVGAEIHGLPDKDGKPVADDVSGYKYLSLQLYATGVTSVMVEFISRGQGISIESGSPQKIFKVTPGFNTYRVPLNSLSQPSYVEVRVNPKDLLKKLTAVNVAVSCSQCLPTKGTVVIDNLVFEK